MKHDYSSPLGKSNSKLSEGYIAPTKTTSKKGLQGPTRVFGRTSSPLQNGNSGTTGPNSATFRPKPR